MDTVDIIKRRVRRQIENCKSFGMAPDDLHILDPLTGKRPDTWERVEELLIDIRLSQRRRE